MDVLAKSVELAGTYHAGQVDKAGVPYIRHALAVLQNVVKLTAGTAPLNVLAAAVMHDLVEDTEMTAKQLLDHGFPFEVVELVTVLSRDKTFESYQQFITRVIAHGRAAATIKLADVMDNIDVTRLDPAAVQDRDFTRLLRYRQAHAELLPIVTGSWKA